MRRTVWAVTTTLALFVAAYAVGNVVFTGIRTPFVAALFSEKWLRALAHLGAGGVAMAVGAFQFGARLRARRPRVHRLLGKVYVIAVAVSGIAALLLAPVSDGGVPAHFGFALLAVLWLATTGMAFVRIRARDFAGHREWMIRSYALCLAAVTLRIYLPVSQVTGIPFEEAYPAIAWLCWVPNLIIAEWIVVRGPFARLEIMEETVVAPHRT